MPGSNIDSNIPEYLFSMDNDAIMLSAIFDGWVQYNDALIDALDSLSDEILTKSTLPDGHSAAHIFRHIALGRIEWLVRIDAPGFDELAARIPDWKFLPDGVRYSISDSIPLERALIRDLLCATATAIDATLRTWDVSCLDDTYRHPFRGTVYAVSKQWTLMRILMHDIHHGGQLSLICQQNGIEPLKLVWLGGHLPEPAIWDGD